MKLIKWILIIGFLVLCFTNVYTHANSDNFQKYLKHGVSTGTDIEKMDDVGLRMLEEYRQYLLKKEAEKANNIIRLDSKSVQISARRNGYDLVVKIKNISSDTLNLVPMKFTVLSKIYMKENKKWMDFAVDSDPLYITHIEVLNEGETVKKQFELPQDFSSDVGGRLSLGAPSINFTDKGEVVANIKSIANVSF